MGRKRIYTYAATIILLVGAGFFVFTSLRSDQQQVSDESADITIVEPQCEKDVAPNNEPQEECVTPPGIDNSNDTSPIPEPSSQPEPVIEPRVEPLQSTPNEISQGNTNKKQVIFTFDGGAGNQSLAAILDTLNKHKVKSTFFVTGKWADTYSKELKQISAEGHEVFNHTYNHPNLTTVSDQTIVKEFLLTEQSIEKHLNKTTKPYFRPPYGARNQNVLDIAWSEGYRSVYWTIDALDWQETATDASVKKRILDNVSPGSIYLMHIGDEITGRVLDEIFTTIKSRGYSIVSLTGGL